MAEPERCPWCLGDPLSRDYHDREWGVPVHDERLHFEFIILESFQAGLSWLTMLRKRENFRAAFDNFRPEVIARYDDAKKAALLADPGIIRNRLKIDAAVDNARVFIRLQEEHDGFDNWIWRFTDGLPVVGHRQTGRDVPVKTELSDRMAAAMKKEGFRFMGSVTLYAHLQGIGMVNDHLTGCFRFQELIKK
jgi:DNA-3-methyladenine glycosylase I